MSPLISHKNGLRSAHFCASFPQGGKLWALPRQKRKQQINLLANAKQAARVGGLFYIY